MENAHEINVIVDDYVKVILTIPDTISALELQGIMLKAGKISALSTNTLMVTKRKYNKSGTYSKNDDMSETKKYGGHKRVWTPEKKKILINALKNKGNKSNTELYNEVAEKVGVTYDQVYDKVHNMKIRGY